MRGLSESERSASGWRASGVIAACCGAVVSRAAMSWALTLCGLNGSWTASRACACASWNSSSACVGRAFPHRPRPIRAGVVFLRRAKGSFALIAQELLAGTGGELRVANAAALIGDACAGEPLGEFRSWPQPQDASNIQRIMVAGALIIQHDVIGARNAHDEGDSRGAEESENTVHVILVGFGVVGVTDIHAHGQAEELAAKMILQGGSRDLLTVIEVFGADEADYGIHQQGLKGARYRVGPGLEGLLINPLMRTGGERRALPGLEIHDVRAYRVPAQGQARIAALAQQGEVDAEAAVGGLGTGNGLKHEIHRRMALDGGNRVGNMGQNTTLGWNGMTLPQIVEDLQQQDLSLDTVGCGVDADDGIATAE